MSLPENCENCGGTGYGVIDSYGVPCGKCNGKGDNKMFFKDENGINCVELGNGDVSITIIKPENTTQDNKCVGIAFCEERKAGNIGEVIDGRIGKRDFEVNTKIKILFTKKESIDVVIRVLNDIKERMVKPNKL